MLCHTAHYVGVVMLHCQSGQFILSQSHLGCQIVWVEVMNKQERVYL